MGGFSLRRPCATIRPDEVPNRFKKIKPMLTDTLSPIRRTLIRWYKKHQRDLPWRRTRNPYAVWVSEIMLQQTQVATVIPYYRRFMKAFPTIKRLAAAREQAVLKAWEGLGYYSRARNLYKAAKRIISDHGGRLPESAEELRQLPGIGRYTAGAIASIAFDLDEPVLDGNVIRVFCRLFLIRKNPKETTIQKRLWRLAHQLLPKGKASIFNQALMDLGATVCTPKNPRCNDCPLKKHCKARAKNLQERLPAKAKTAPVPHYDIAAGVIWKGKKILIARRKPEGLLGGLWEFPGGKRKKNESLEDCVVREIHEELQVKVKVIRPLKTVRHAYSHFRITLHAFECEYLSGRPKALGCAAWKWVTLDDLAHYPFPRANQKILETLCDGA